MGKHGTGALLTQSAMRRHQDYMDKHPIRCNRMDMTYDHIMALQEIR